ncbi:hypothetical protein BDR07DRAFT_526487 [Suillus spraguei]|nr:hypothetical protein BDR07DRAFT_526487 [Suillus spraguei]
MTYDRFALSVSKQSVARTSRTCYTAKYSLAWAKWWRMMCCAAAVPALSATDIVVSEMDLITCNSGELHLRPDIFLLSSQKLCTRILTYSVLGAGIDVNHCFVAGYLSRVTSNSYDTDS